MRNLNDCMSDFQRGYVQALRDAVDRLKQIRDDYDVGKTIVDDCIEAIASEGARAAEDFHDSVL